MTTLDSPDQDPTLEDQLEVFVLTEFRGAQGCSARITVAHLLVQ